MVLVPVTVTDRGGALITGLSAQAFTVTQDNVPQRISSFGEEDIPASIGVILDTSGSMRQILPQAKTMLKAFFEQCNPQDEAFVYTVSSRPETDGTYTSDFGALLSHTAFYEAKGATALTDTVFAAVRKSREGQRSRKVLLVISDGRDNHSRYSKAELLSAAMEADLQIYTISVFDPPRNKKAVELQEERSGIAFLEELSHKTGGLHIVVRNRQDVGNAARQIGKAIRNQYILGYVPQGTPGESKWHPIQVRINLPHATAWSRSGYFATNR